MLTSDQAPSRTARFAWRALGFAVILAIAIPGARLITRAGVSHPQLGLVSSSRTFAVPQPVSSVTVNSDGATVVIATANVARVRVVETVESSPDTAGPVSAVPGPAVPDSAAPGLAVVSGDHLTIDDPGCTGEENCVRFAVTVPRGTSVVVVSEGGDVSVSGAAGAYLESGGGTVRATGIGGPLTADMAGGSVAADGVSGALRADTLGGDLTAVNVTAASAVITTGGGNMRLTFSAPPATVTFSTGGGDATLRLPGGPYALTGSTDDAATTTVRIATHPAAKRIIDVSTGGGNLLILPV